jgi:hypothetical protein
VNGAIVGTGIQGILNLRPRFFWDAHDALNAVGPAPGGAPTAVAIYETTSQASTVKWLTMDSDKRWRFMEAGIDTAAGQNRCLGSVGGFFASTTNYFTAYTTAKYSFAVVTPTAAGQLTEDAADFPSIVRDGDIATSRYRVYLDTSTDAVNDVVVERSQTRSSTLVRTFQVLVRNDSLTDPSGNNELGYNTTAGTRTTEAPWLRSLGYDGWYVASILVPSSGGGSTTGYMSIMAKADTGVWEIALPLFFTSGSTPERITRAGLPSSSDARLKYALKTTSAELCLRPTGWMAMSLVLPDRSVSNGHTDNAGAANYRFLGMLNLDCATWRLRVSMSDTYDQVVVNLGDTSGTNFAFLNGPVDWDDFAALGIVVTWFTSNQSKFVTMYINGVKMDSVQDPATWYPDTVAPGTLYVGISENDGVIAETFISRVAYGMNRMHRSTARALSSHMARLARGGTPWILPPAPPPEA